MQPRSTARISSAKIYAAMQDLESKLNALGAIDEARQVKAEKEKLMHNMAEEYRAIPMPLPIAWSIEHVIDWGDY